MISNSSNNKLKASKSSRDLEDCGRESDEGSSPRIALRPRSEGNNDDRPVSTVVFTSRDSRYKTTSRARSGAEFRRSRGAPADRRSAPTRTRGGFSRKADRDNIDHYTGRKFQESMSVNKSCDSLNITSNYNNKYNDFEVKSGVNYNLPEDPRISKLLRRLCTETDPEKALALCSKLQEMILVGDNARYIRRSFDILGESINDVLRNGPLQCRSEAARALGKMGHILNTDFRRYWDWLVSRYSSELSEVKALLMKALYETFLLDSQHPVLEEYATSTMEHLQSLLENTHSPAIFIATMDVIVLLSQSYPKSLEPVFVDIVDILVGWHLDVLQSESIKFHAASTLQKFHLFWKSDLTFSEYLLGQFLEDIVVYGDDLAQPQSGRNSPLEETPLTPRECINRIAGLIEVFNTVMKSLSGSLDSVDFLTDCLQKVLKTVEQAIKVFPDQKLIYAANECIFLLLAALKSKVTSHSIEGICSLITLQLDIATEFNENSTLSILAMISQTIKEVSASFPLDLIDVLVGNNSVLLSLRVSQSVKVQNAVIHIYQNLLALRNIPLLQEAYKHILSDLEAAFTCLTSGSDNLPSDFQTSYSKADAQMIILFHLRCLSDLANASNSIIAMWALQPSILELLAVRTQPGNITIWREYSAIQHSVYYLLYMHCSKNNNFVGSSELTICSQKRANVCNILGITLNQEEASPTSGHYTIILKLISTSLNIELSTETLNLILNWCKELLFHSEKYITNLITNEDFLNVVESIVKKGSGNKNTAESICECLEIVLRVPNVNWPLPLLKLICDLCVMHMCNNVSKLKTMYLKLSSLIPITVCLMHFNNPQTIAYERMTKIKALQKWHFQTESCGEMLPHYFKIFMNYMLHGIVDEPDWLQEIFLCSWSSDSGPAERFKQLALIDERPLLLWSEWEAAQLCINFKLRTPLGKPQDTFMSIEGAIKIIARAVTSDGEEVAFPDVVSLIEEQRRIRILLGFVEQLEKSIYNASEGTAACMPQAEKPVRSFFRTNASTCREWLSRIRCAVMMVALHAMSSTTAIRHGEALLKDMINAGNIDRPDFERAVINLATALILNKENDTLEGLYQWIKQVANKKIPWLKAAADQAAGKFELAADGYSKILKDEIENSNGQSDIQLISFACDQLSNCYVGLGNWNELAKWKTKEITMWESKDRENPQKITMNNITADQATAMAMYDDNDIKYMDYLADWDCLKPTETLPRSNFSYQKLLGQTEATLTSIALNLVAGNEVSFYNSDIAKSLIITENCIQESIRDPRTEFLSEAIILHNVAVGLRQVINKNISNFKINDTYKSINSVTMGKVLWWSEFFETLNTGQRSCLSSLRLDLASMSRKQGNYKLCKTQLQKYFSVSNTFNLSEAGDKIFLENVSDVIIKATTQLEGGVWDMNTARAISETAKLFYCNSETRETAIHLSAAASLGICQRVNNNVNDNNVNLRERAARMLLTLSKWVQVENDKLLTNDLSSPLTRLVTALPDIGLGDGCRSEQVVPILDAAVGKLIQYGVRQCPTLAKAWGALGAWCYRWGRKMVELGPEGEGTLSENDRLTIQNLIPGGAQPSDIEQVVRILTQTRSATDEEDIDSNVINTSEMIESQLQEIQCLADLPKCHLATLVDVWRQSEKRMYGYYDLAADAYFKYLQLASANDASDCGSVTITLRLLRLVVKHAMGLQNVLEAGLATTPTQPWKVIIPQLFSRLNHPESYVRRRVSELLCRVAEDAPHLITFPAVVGAAQGQKLDLTDISMPTECEDDMEIPEDDCEREVEQEATLAFCFTSMVDTLAKQAPETILQVQLLVSELRRITLLWDELWLGSLIQLHAEFTRRLSQIESELSRLKSNTSLSQIEKDHLLTEKYRIIMKPVIFVLEQLYTMTSRGPETPHESQFQDRFLTSIEDILENLRQPINVQKPTESWIPLKTFQSQLQQRAHKKASYSLKMSEISPALANLKNTVISMPGLHSKQRVTIMSVDNTVSILPTKTKPKKLVFHGSDGKKYTYLFKGLEDLHLDERIMQFLSITNTMMSKNGEKGFRARHYSVIPLGPRSGLISWVDNVTPLFALYKRWQQREAANPNPKATKVQNVLRPSDLFYNKLTPLLREKGIKNTSNRKELPVSVLKQVLEELTNETPQDLLSREIWCHSHSAAAWRQAVKTYTHSVAVMSVIGYVIGLGDRHLDNVLVELGTGEVVHIDYNVCFEKGRTLRVPEKVPFRMTPNLKTALGVTGVEGSFRLACEQVMKTVRKGRETLLTLLEAFVYDPLVDWAIGEGAGAVAAAAYGGGVLGGDLRVARRQLEREVTRDMLAVRFTEIRPQWGENRDDISRQINLLSGYLEQYIAEQQSSNKSMELLQSLNSQSDLVRDALNHGNNLQGHPLQSVAKRYAVFKKMRDSYDTSEKALQDKIEECDRHIVLHANALDAVKGPQLAHWLTELSFPVAHDGHLVFDLVREFLQSAGQSAMITQCDQSEQELYSLAQQQAGYIKGCLDLLGQYGAVARLYPSSYHEQHRSERYLHWAKMLLETKSPQLCREVVAQFQNSLGPESTNNPIVQQVVSFSYQLQSIVGDANIKLQKIYDRIKNENVDGVRVEKNFSDAKLGISTFLRQEKGSSKALECVSITTLRILNQRFLMMEAAASSSGDCLVDLTTRDGDWFFDDLRVMSSMIVELCNFIPIQNATKCDDKLQLAFNSLKLSNALYKSLHDLNNNFHGIILPEIIRGIQSEDASILSIVSTINDLIMTSGLPLSDLLSQMEMDLRFVIMEMESPHANIQTIVSDLKTKFDALMEANTPSENDNSTLTSGQMLLLGFSGLFDKLKRENELLSQSLQVLNSGIVPAWRKIDQIREAKNLAAHALSESTRSALTSIFFVKTLQTMQEVFTLVLQMSRAFKGAGIATVYDDERLLRPVKRFTADYVTRQLLGVTPHTLAITLCLLLQRNNLNVTVEVEQKDVGAESKVPLEDLCNKAVDVNLKKGYFTSNVFSQAHSLIGNLELSWRRKELHKALQEYLNINRNSLQRLQLQLTAHHWLHEDVIALQPGLSVMAPLIRSAFMLELRKTSQALLALKPRVQEALEAQHVLVLSAEQRLKWAAGANPALTEVMAAFECAVKLRDERISVEQNLAAAVGKTCNALLHHEALRTRTSEGVSNDQVFLDLVSQWEKSCTLVDSCTATVSDVEESLMELLDPEGNVDIHWLNNVKALIQVMIGQNEKELENQTTNINSIEDSIKSCLQKSRSHLSQHNQLASDVRSLLKSMLKTDGERAVGLREYLARYKHFLELMSSILTALNVKEFKLEVLQGVLNNVTDVKQLINSVFDDLFLFENDTKIKRPPLLRQDSVCSSPKKESQHPIKAPETEQKRNAYAVSVWRRVRMKLEGRDPDPIRRCSPSEQIDFVIREATNEENLALLYEGWTPWV